MVHINGIFRTALTTSGIMTASTSRCLVDINLAGKPTKALVQAHRNGYFYCLNRENGEFLYGKPFCEVTWTDRTKGPTVSIPRRAGRLSTRPRCRRKRASRVCPGAAGGKEWNPMAFDPEHGSALSSR